MVAHRELHGKKLRLKGNIMSEELIIKLGQDALRTTAMLAGPILISTLVIGLAVSIFQALTQIN